MSARCPQVVSQFSHLSVSSPVCVRNGGQSSLSGQSATDISISPQHKNIPEFSFFLSLSKLKELFRFQFGT